MRPELNHLFELENATERHHQLVDEAVDAVRKTLDKAIVQRRDGKMYRISSLRAFRGAVMVEGIRLDGKSLGTRKIDLGRLQNLQIIALYDPALDPTKGTSGKGRPSSNGKNHPENPT